MIWHDEPPRRHSYFEQGNRKKRRVHLRTQSKREARGRKRSRRKGKR